MIVRYFCRGRGTGGDNFRLIDIVTSFGADSGMIPPGSITFAKQHMPGAPAVEYVYEFDKVVEQ